MYIKEEFQAQTTTEKFGRTGFLNKIIKTVNNEVINNSAIYGHHNNKKVDFIEKTRLFIRSSEETTNHFITGDFNIDFINPDLYAEYFYNNFLERDCFPCIWTIIRSND